MRLVKLALLRHCQRISLAVTGLQTRFPEKELTQSKTYRANKPVNSPASESAAHVLRDGWCAPRRHTSEIHKVLPRDAEVINTSPETDWRGDTYFADGRQQVYPRCASAVALACERQPPSPTTIPSFFQRVRRLSSWRLSIVAVVKSKPQRRPASSHCTCHLKPYRAGNRVTSDDESKDEGGN